MKVMLDSPVEYVTPRGRVYWLGDIPAKGGGTHRVALALADQGTAAATYRATLLSEDFPELDAILMVGIAGGVPNVSKPDRHVRLGDIVASGEHGVIAYDFVKEHAKFTEPRHPPRPPHQGLYQACRRLHAGALEGLRPWLGHASRAAHLPHASRPAQEGDQLSDSRDSTMQLAHPSDPDRRPGEPRVFIGTIACANRLLKNPVHRDQVRDDFDVRAVEMEGFGIAEATWSQNVGFLVVRGICDYCDSHKGDAWQGYAAVIAAAYARAVLEEMPAAPRTQTLPIAREVRSDRIPEATLRRIAQALLAAGTPPAVAALFPNAPEHARGALRELEGVRRTATRAAKANGSAAAALVDLAGDTTLHHIVVAPPGSGKTHALWHAAQALLSTGERIPLYVSTGSAATWRDVEQRVGELTEGADVRDLLRDQRACVMLDGWSEFATGSGAVERTAAMRVLNGTKVVATGRRGHVTDSYFEVWMLEPLTPQSVSRAVKKALPHAAPPPSDMAELLRVPLALSLYILLGGSATTRGELIAAFHEHLSEGFPDAFRDALAGAVAAVTLARRGRSSRFLAEEFRGRAVHANLSHAQALLRRLGTLEEQGTTVVPVHDLYWSWLAGIGILLEDQITASLPTLATRESIDLAVESGVRPHSSSIDAARDVDAVLAATLGSRFGADVVATATRDRVVDMLRSPLLPVRCRGAVAALRSRDDALVRSSLDVISAARESNIHVPALADAIHPDALYVSRGTIAEWLGSVGSDLVVEAIAEHGDERWSPWLAQMAAGGKLTYPVAVAAALACEARIPDWTKPHLATVMGGEAYRLRPAARRGANHELAMWIADHYGSHVELRHSGWFNLNEVLTRCGDDRVWARLLERFDTLPPSAQETLGFAVVERGDPWLGRFQKKAFASGAAAHHHRLAEPVSLEIDDDTARSWIAREPAVLGWRVLISRHQNRIVPDLLAALPESFHDLDAIPALKAMQYLVHPPESLADEIWRRVRGTMTPMAMEDVLFALAAIRTRGVPLVVGTLVRRPSFLPSYHFVRFVDILSKWQRDTGVTIRVTERENQLSFLEWIVVRRIPLDRDDDLFRSRLGPVRDAFAPIFLAHFREDPATYARLLAACGRVDRYHAGLVEHLLATPGQAAQIPEVFSTAFDTFPETVLETVLDAPGVDFRKMVRSLAASSTPVHARLHATVARRLLARDFDIWAHRDVAHALRVHPRGVLLRILKEVVGDQASDEARLWLVREVEAASGELLINERGEWLS